MDPTLEFVEAEIRPFSVPGASAPRALYLAGTADHVDTLGFVPVFREAVRSKPYRVRYTVSPKEEDLKVAWSRGGSCVMTRDLCFFSVCFIPKQWQGRFVRREVLR